MSKSIKWGNDLLSVKQCLTNMMYSSPEELKSLAHTELAKQALALIHDHERNAGKMLRMLHSLKQFMEDGIASGSITLPEEVDADEHDVLPDVVNIISYVTNWNNLQK